MNTKNNQRFRSIDAALKAAMLAVMQEKGVDEICVGEICQRADVNRSTFYAHYKDIYGLLQTMADDLGEALLSEVTMIENGSPYIDYLLPYFAHIKKHRSFYKPAMLCRNPLPMEKELAFLHDKVVIPRCRAKGITDERKIMYHAAFFQAGITSVFRRWLEKDCAEEETEMLAVMQKYLAQE